MRSAILAARSVGRASASSKPLVCSDWVPPRDGGEALQRDAHDVVLRLLGGEGHPAGLGVEAQPQRALVLGAEALAHDRRPHPPRRAELRDLLEDVVVAVEEEGQARGEVVDGQAGVERRLHVGDAAAQREGDLLDGGAALLPEVVARDRARVPLRHVLVAVGEEVGGQAHRRHRRVDVVAARDVLLEHVVLRRPAQLLARDALLLAHELVEQQQHRGGRVDRHRRRDLVERDRVERRAHVVDRVDGHARAARPRPGSAGCRSPGRAGWAGRRPSTGPSSRAPAGSGSARWTPWPTRSPRTGASSTAACGTSRDAGRACRGTRPARPGAGPPAGRPRCRAARPRSPSP